MSEFTDILGFVPVVLIQSYRTEADRVAEQPYHEAAAGNDTSAAIALRTFAGRIPVDEVWEIDEDGTGRTRTVATDADLERVAQDKERTR